MTTNLDFDALEAAITKCAGRSNFRWASPMIGACNVACDFQLADGDKSSPIASFLAHEEIELYVALRNNAPELLRRARENARLEAAVIDAGELCKMANNVMAKYEAELTTLRAANLAAQKLIDEARAETADVRQQLEDAQLIAREKNDLAIAKVFENQQLREQLTDAQATITELRIQNGILNRRNNGLIAQRASEAIPGGMVLVPIGLLKRVVNANPYTMTPNEYDSFRREFSNMIAAAKGQP